MMTGTEQLKRLLETMGYEDVSGFSEYRKILVLAAIAAVLFVTAVVAVVMGKYGFTVMDVYRTIFVHLTFGDTSAIDKLNNTIIWDIRVPRILLTIFVGGALAVAGAVFQGVFKNPLVEPYILGVSSGAAFGAALGIVYPAIFISIQLSAFVFGGLAVAVAYLLARVRGETPIVTLILAGVIVGSIFAALVSLLKYLSTDAALREIVFWMMGGFYYATWKDVQVIAPVVTIGFIILWAFGWKLNILSMGDDEARTLGVNPERYKFIVIGIATAVTAFAVSLVGIVAWVGLMMPHASRILLGPDNRYVIPASFMMGGIYLVICDTLARTLTNAEIPVGIIASILGAPYLCYLLRNKGRVIFG
ncbi:MULTISPECIES: iron ABC transporter permease [unclassified Methanoregula]|uniref:FecCD family ABC transporter permease n=1 Tax=unclassified Methanoregula TaxID=2649730 RepID=UPI0009C7D302|nr:MULTISPECIES: iron ABC transporter permease [unclassified Methanoregula]OPX61838.1 MAG: Cobalamin import system permease protein BtuC [Methanoregula sp. PtaB.Bin085]OPY35084.1 MAG: Cobalamin import system permease protein BtuC [Methanoregula sp. PtaU1.Bin006]